MKKIFCKILLFVILGITTSATSATSATSFSGSSPLSDLTPEEIAIKQATSPIHPERERSAVKSVEAYLHRVSGEVHIYFNKNIGTVNIDIISDANEFICLIGCDTAQQTELVLNISKEPGTYALHILGREFNGTGTYSY